MLTNIRVYIENTAIYWENEERNRQNALSYSIHTRDVPIHTRDVPILRYAFNQIIIDIYDKCSNINLSASEREYAQCTYYIAIEMNTNWCQRWKILSQLLGELK